MNVSAAISEERSSARREGEVVERDKRHLVEEDTATDAVLSFAPSVASRRGSYEDNRVVVCVRARPLNAREMVVSLLEAEAVAATLSSSAPSRQDGCSEAGAMCLQFFNGTTIGVTESFRAATDLQASIAANTAHSFTYDHAYSPEVTQEAVYNDLGRPVLTSSFQGFNTCIFAYGQTGSGKSYCMMGPEGGRDVTRCPGIVPRLCVDLFEEIRLRIRQNEQERQDFALSYRADTPGAARRRGSRMHDEEGEGSVMPPRLEVYVYASYMEIYRERVRCLLHQQQHQLPLSETTSIGGDFNKSENNNGNLRVRQHPTLGVYVEGLKEVPVSTVEQVMNLLQMGNGNRHTAATRMNDVSSRSHAIFTLQIIQRKRGTTRAGEATVTELSAKTNLVDLAGSERARSTGAEGGTLIEGAQINKSLSVLGLVIKTLSDASKSRQAPRHVPYRDSTLTFLLKESLGGNSKTFMLATVSPSRVPYEETLTTLRYADRAKAIVSRAFVNESVGDKRIRELEEEVARLRLRIRELYAGAQGGLQQRLQRKLAEEEVDSTPPKDRSKTERMDNKELTADAHGALGCLRNVSGEYVSGSENVDDFDLREATDANTSAKDAENQQGARAAVVSSDSSDWLAQEDEDIEDLMAEAAHVQAVLRQFTATDAERTEEAAAMHTAAAARAQHRSTLRVRRQDPYVLNLSGCGDWILAHLTTDVTLIGYFGEVDEDIILSTTSEEDESSNKRKGEHHDGGLSHSLTLSSSSELEFTDADTSTCSSSARGDGNDGGGGAAVVAVVNLRQQHRRIKLCSVKHIIVPEAYSRGVGAPHVRLKRRGVAGNVVVACPLPGHDTFLNDASEPLTTRTVLVSGDVLTLGADGLQLRFVDPAAPPLPASDEGNLKPVPKLSTISSPINALSLRRMETDGDAAPRQQQMQQEVMCESTDARFADVAISKTQRVISGEQNASALVKEGQRAAQPVQVHLEIFASTIDVNSSGEMNHVERDTAAGTAASAECNDPRSFKQVLQHISENTLGAMPSAPLTQGQSQHTNDTQEGVFEAKDKAAEALSGGHQERTGALLIPQPRLPLFAPLPSPAAAKSLETVDAAKSLLQVSASACASSPQSFSSLSADAAERSETTAIQPPAGVSDGSGAAVRHPTRKKPSLGRTSTKDPAHTRVRRPLQKETPLLLNEDRQFVARHTFVFVGPTGSGKTALRHNLVTPDRSWLPSLLWRGSAGPATPIGRTCGVSTSTVTVSGEAVQRFGAATGARDGSVPVELRLTELGGCGCFSWLLDQLPSRSVTYALCYDVSSRPTLRDLRNVLEHLLCIASSADVSVLLVGTHMDTAATGTFLSVSFEDEAAVGPFPVAEQFSWLEELETEASGFVEVLQPDPLLRPRFTGCILVDNSGRRVCKPGFEKVTTMPQLLHWFADHAYRQCCRRGGGTAETSTASSAVGSVGVADFSVAMSFDAYFPRGLVPLRCLALARRLGSLLASSAHIDGQWCLSMREYRRLAEAVDPRYGRAGTDLQAHTQLLASWGVVQNYHSLREKLKDIVVVDVPWLLRLLTCISCCGIVKSVEDGRELVLLSAAKVMRGLFDASELPFSLDHVVAADTFGLLRDGVMTLRVLSVLTEQQLQLYRLASGSSFRREISSCPEMNKNGKEGGEDGVDDSKHQLLALVELLECYDVVLRGSQLLYSSQSGEGNQLLTGPTARVAPYAAELPESFVLMPSTFRARTPSSITMSLPMCLTGPIYRFTFSLVPPHFFSKIVARLGSHPSGHKLYVGPVDLCSVPNTTAPEDAAAVMMMPTLSHCHAAAPSAAISTTFTSITIPAGRRQFWNSAVWVAASNNGCRALVRIVRHSLLVVFDELPPSFPPDRETYSDTRAVSRFYDNVLDTVHSVIREFTGACCEAYLLCRSKMAARGDAAPNLEGEEGLLSDTYYRLIDENINSFEKIRALETNWAQTITARAARRGGGTHEVGVSHVATRPSGCAWHEDDDEETGSFCEDDAPTAVPYMLSRDVVERFDVDAIAKHICSLIEPAQRTTSVEEKIRGCLMKMTRAAESNSADARAAALDSLVDTLAQL